MYVDKRVTLCCLRGRIGDRKLSSTSYLGGGQIEIIPLVWPRRYGSLLRTLAIFTSRLEVITLRQSGFANMRGHSG
jgi:hypothetical protein